MPIPFRENTVPGRKSMAEKFRCAHCRKLCSPNPRAKNQKYCGKPACRRARRAAWQRKKIRSDPDYQENQRRCQNDWTRNNPGYWREWREQHPDYVANNRLQQHRRDRKRSLAKMDSLRSEKSISKGIYSLIPCSGDNLAKMDPLTVEISVLAGSSGSVTPILQRRTR